MRRSRLVLGTVAVAAVVAAAFTSSSALGAAAPATPPKATFTPARACLYPPQTRPAVTISAPASVRRNKSFAVSGVVKYNSCGLPAWPVTLFRSTDGGATFQQVASTLTASSGTFSFTIPGITAATKYRAVTPAWFGLQSTTSNTVTVTVTTS